MARIFQNEHIVFQVNFLVITSLSLLTLPIRWTIAWTIAIFFHELCHYIALHICKVPVFRIRVGAFGIDIQTGSMTKGQEIISALAGPLGSFLLLLLVRVFPYVSLCACGQLLFNLIPIYPLDGGRALTGICVLLFGEHKGFWICKVISVFFVTFLFCVSLISSFYYNLGIAPILISLLIVARALKIPCKERQLIVQ